MPDDWTMGALAAQDAYRLLGNDPWTGLMRGSADLPLGGVAAPRDDTVAFGTASPLVNITRQDIADATDKAMAFSGGGLGIKAYHSSPHDFERFDLSKIGTGEGAQVYGHGLYFAENPAVSGQGGQYWNSFVPHMNPAEQTAARYFQENEFNRAHAIEGLQQSIEWDRSLGKVNPHEEEALQLLLGGKPVGPRTYEVDINAEPSHFLDWDKSLAQMSPEVQDRLAKAWLAHPEGHSRMSGSDIYRATQDDAAFKSGRVGSGSSPSAFKAFDVAASEKLNEAGIPGIKYLDAGSRAHWANDAYVTKPDERGLYHVNGAGIHTPFSSQAEAQAALNKAIAADPPSSNYVVFNPGIIDILRKYGLAGAAPIGMGALAAQDQYQSQ